MLGRILEHLKLNGKHPKHSTWHEVQEFMQIRFADHYRVLCYYPPNENMTIVLLHAFYKDVQETPETDLNIARRYKAVDIAERKAIKEKADREKEKQQGNSNKQIKRKKRGK